VRLLCLLGFHKRSGSHAFENNEGTFVSMCRRCGKAMERQPSGKWVAIGSSGSNGRANEDPSAAT